MKISFRWCEYTIKAPSIKVAHKKALYIRPAKYLICHVEMKTYRIASFSFIKESAVNGAYHQNPFNFEHFNLNYVTLNVNSRQQPAKVFTPVF